MKRGRPWRYRLNDAGEPVHDPDLLAHTEWFETADRHVADTHLADARVSTIFLGYDHQWTGEGPPILWESMVFGGPLDEEQIRYSSRADAEAGHAALVVRVLAAPRQLALPGPEPDHGN